MHEQALLRVTSEAPRQIHYSLLTPRPREILRLVSIRHTNREIVKLLGIGVGTVGEDRSNLMHRIQRAMELGLVAPSLIAPPPMTRHHAPEREEWPG
ncbi:MAG: hypothetical protein ACREJN_16510 [Nitrospiraceae bacterium]